MKNVAEAVRVLVVDDEESITDGLTMLLELEEMDASGAYDRATAELLLKEGSFSVILADFRLVTEEDGLLLLDSIRRLSPSSKIASLTAFATPELEVELKRRGSSVVLQKPLAFAEIVAVIRELLDEIEVEAQAQVERTGEPLDLVALYGEVKKVLWAIPQRKYHLTPDETEDLVQEAWLLFLEKQGTIRSPKSWLAGTIVNLSRQTITRNMRYGDSPGVEAAGEIPPILDVLMVKQALARLDGRSRLLCTLIGMEGRSYEEVSTALDLPIGSVGPLYMRAKQKLRKRLDVSH
jgi:DNA-directed RNA polymerase specialized sigma24 family protein